MRADQHFTEPPPRYSEASLVKKMEELGIGRPSTYASILTVLRDRAYVRMDKNRFVPEDKGRLVTAFLEQFFRRYVEYDFTAALEEKLDLVSAGELDWKALLRDFWRDFHAAVGEIGELRMGQVIEALNEALGPHIFPDKGDGDRPARLPHLRHGPAVAEDRPLRRLRRLLQLSGMPLHPPDRPGERRGRAAASAATASWASIRPPATPIWLKAGRFGPYVEEQGEKPKRASLPKDWPPAAMDLDKAIRLLRLPREVGAHPDDGKHDPGRHRPLRPLRRSTTAPTPTSPTADEVFEVGLNRAVAVLAEKRAGGRGGRGRGDAQALAELGAHPADGEPVRVLAGRYGPYIKHGATNANVPRGADPAALTLDEAVKLLAEREAKGPSTGKRGRTATKAAAPAKAKKPAAKKKPAKARKAK